jgi:peptide/nickel transport system substrate-binding protein
MGPAYEDVADIRTISPRDIEFSLRQPSSLLIEAIGDADIQENGPALSGTGPFSVAEEQPGEILLRANENYHGGKPTVDRVVVKPYASVRSAWAEMLRGQVDVLFDVGIDALDSLESSTDIGVFAFQRGYAYMLLLNVQRPVLRDPAFRRQLNMAIDRPALIAEGLRGHGTPATGPVWLNHWAYSDDLPQFAYRPRPVTGSRRVTLKCLLPEPSLERLALVLQRQLQVIGVDLEFELVSLEQFAARVISGRGDFDAAITDAQQGPNMVRPYKWWHSGAPANYGHFSSVRVDAALDSIRHAPDETAYRAGVAAFQGAMIDDPPAVFLVWRERARAVSRRFVVPPDPKNDVLLSIRLWRPADSGVASTN